MLNPLEARKEKTIGDAAAGGLGIERVNKNTIIPTWTHGIDLDSWYSICTLESHAYERTECCPFA